MTDAEKDRALGQDIKNRVMNHLVKSPDIDIIMVRDTFYSTYAEHCHDELDVVISRTLNDVREHQLDLQSDWNNVWNIISWAFQVEWDETIENWVKMVSRVLINPSTDREPKKISFQEKLKGFLMALGSLVCVSMSGVLFVTGPYWLGVVLILIGSVSSLYTIPLFSKSFE